MLEAVRDFFATANSGMGSATSERRGVKLAGGIRTSKEAIRYLVMVNEVAGDEWLTPDLFRFGASTLLNDLLQQRHKLTSGSYDGPDYVTVD
jgi:deoxyribose-phosphate aldolase